MKKYTPYLIITGIILLSLLLWYVLTPTTYDKSNYEPNLKSSNSSPPTLLSCVPICLDCPVNSTCVAPNVCVQNSIDTSNFKNTYILDSSMSNVQTIINNIAVQQGTSCLQNQYQFGTNRALILLKPGVYKGIVLYVGYYTSIAGLGKSPEDVVVDGLQVYDGYTVDSQNKPCVPVAGQPPNGGRSTDNFWRSVENLTVSNNAQWSVSQACPLRRVYFKQNLSVFESGYASGGFTADSVIDGTINIGGNQQWFFRNCRIGKQPTCQMWNIGYLGCSGEGNTYCDNGKQCISMDDSNLTTAQKPTLFLDSDGKYKVLKPAPKVGAGAINLSDYTDGDVLTNFYVVNSSNNAAFINSKISQGYNIILSPGIYNLETSIVVSRAGTIILGYGMPTLVSSQLNPCIIVQDVSDVVIASVIFDVGYGHYEVPSLLKWGVTKNNNNNTGYAYDIFARVGGAVNYPTYCLTMVEINNNGIIGDNFWLWRADHGYGLNGNTNDFIWNLGLNGLVVNGSNVTMYGLAVEHCQKDLVLWNGENGATYWFQSEIPYDAPDVWNYYAYHVADNVQNHTGIAMGAYAFPYSSTMKLGDAFKTPANSNMKYLLVYKGKSGFNTIWNGKGDVSKLVNGVAHLC